MCDIMAWQGALPPACITKRAQFALGFGVQCAVCSVQCVVCSG